MSYVSSLSAWDCIDFGSLAMVFIGVFFGYFANKNDSPRKHFWEAILIIGLGIEVLAFPRHVKEIAQLKAEASTNELARVQIEKQIIEITNNVARTDPLNQPITDLSASVYFEVQGTNSEIPPEKTMVFGDSVMILAETNGLWSRFPFLASDKFIPGFSLLSANNSSYSLHFEETGTLAMMVGMPNKRWPVSKISDIKLVYLSFDFLTNNATIVNGTVELRINGNVRRTFFMPSHQLAFKQFPDSPAYAPIWFVATNAPEPLKAIY